MAAHQAPPSLGFSRKNTGVGCHFPLQCMKVKSEREVAQSCLTLSDPMDCSPPGPSVHGIFQARVLEWGAIAFSVTQPYKPSQSLKPVHRPGDKPISNYAKINMGTEKAMAPHSSTLAWKIPWMEEPGRLQSMRSLRVGYD